MKSVVTSLIMFSCSLTFALSETAKISYFENVPNNGQKILFKLDRYCDSDQAPISVQDFYSQKEYPSADSKKMEPVRIIHLYVRSTTNGCNKVLNKKFEKTLEIPTARITTHIYITSDPDVVIQSVQ